MTDKWTHAEAEALGKLPHDERLKMRLGDRLECDMCGDDTSELRWTSESNSRGKPCDPTCQECCPDFSTGGGGDPVMDGPCFDDLPIAQKGAERMTTIAEMKKALEAATSGPWAFDPQSLGAVGHVATNNGESVCQTQPRLEWVDDHQMMIDGRNRNARLIVEAVNNLPALLKVAEAAQVLVSGYSVDRGFPAITQGQFQDLLEAVRGLNNDH